MSVHFTIYPEQPAADALRAFMAAHNCSATAAVELLLARYDDESRAARTSPVDPSPTRFRHAA